MNMNNSNIHVYIAKGYVLASSALLMDVLILLSLTWKEEFNKENLLTWLQLATVCLQQQHKD